MKPILPAALVAAPLFAAHVFGQFIPGNLAVLRVGDGGGSLTTSAAAVSIDQFSMSGLGQSPSYSVALPSTGPSAITLSGTATSEGALVRSADGMYLTFGGFNADAGTLNVAGSTSANVNRAVGMLDAAGVYSLPVKSAKAFTGSDVRGAVTTDGSQFWMSGNASSSSSSGVWAVSGAEETQIASGNLRLVNIVDGKLLYSTGAGTRGVYEFGDLPTSAATATLLIGTGTLTPSPYGFALNPAGNIAYIGDDRSAASGGGIQRWEMVGSTWSLSYTLGTGATVGARGLAVDWTGADPVLFAITAESSANRLIRIEDTGAGSSATTLATASINTLFRGVDFSPVPEPQTYALLALGGAGLFFRLRRRV